MAMFIQPITDQSITKEGKVECQVRAGSVHITTKRNGLTILNDQIFGASPGSSELFDTTVDDAQWSITVIRDSPISSFILTTPD